VLLDCRVMFETPRRHLVQSHDIVTFIECYVHIGNLMLLNIDYSRTGPSATEIWIMRI